jgi:hypothetical protein
MFYALFFAAVQRILATETFLLREGRNRKPRARKLAPVFIHFASNKITVLGGVLWDAIDVVAKSELVLTQAEG